MGWNGGVKFAFGAGWKGRVAKGRGSCSPGPSQGVRLHLLVGPPKLEKRGTTAYRQQMSAVRMTNCKRRAVGRVKLESPAQKAGLTYRGQSRGTPANEER